jgi:uncharacterized protein YbjT (DUF2867 family)
VRVLVAGATGFVGRALTESLSAQGHEATALTRHPDDYRGAGTPVAGDVQEEEATAKALAGHDAAYYLVHSLAEADFVEKDREAARAFGAAAHHAGVQQVIYLGGLGATGDDLSEHLRSRREVESILQERTPTTVLRAGIVVGDGGISWEILRQLVERLPVMITPRWVDTRSQPIALEDALRALTGVLGRTECVGETYELGGRDPLTYRDMMVTVGRLIGRRPLIVPVPLLSPRLSSQWLRLVTDVDLTTAKALVDSLTNEVVVHDHRIEELLGYRPATFAVAARRALDARAERLRAGARERALG